MSWEQKERVVREKRTIEATKKNLMGPSGKLGVIVRALGNPIIRQGSGFNDISYLDDPYENIDEEYETTASEQQGPLVYRDEIEEMSDDFVHHEGFVFDGLSRGMHIEVQYHVVNHKLMLTYKGHVVYKEIAGELEAYAPFDEWEDMVDRLYTASKKSEKAQKQQREIELAEKVKEMKQTFWDRLRTRWGL